MPFKNKYLISKDKESYDIYENRMIKYALKNLRNKIERYPKIYDNQFNKISERLREDKRKYESKYGNIETQLNGISIQIKKIEKEIDELTIEFKDKLTAIYNNKKQGSSKRIIDEYDNIDLVFNIYKYIGAYKQDVSIELERDLIILKYKPNFKEDTFLNLNQDEYKYMKNGEWVDARFYANKFSMEFRTSNINEIVFLIESLFEYEHDNTPIYSISAKAERESNEEDDPLGGEKLEGLFFNNGRQVKSCNIRLKRIYSINGNKPPTYELNYIKDKIEAYISNKDKEDKELKLNSLYEKMDFIQSLDKKISILNKRNRRFINQYKNWDYVLEEIDTLLALDFFKDVKDIKTSWKPSQIFINDLNYSLLCKTMKNLDIEVNFLNEDKEELFRVDVSHRIYEYWVFFKMVEVLMNEQRWEIDNIEDIYNWLQDVNKRKNALKVVLSRSLGYGNDLKLTLFNNKDIFYKENYSSQLKSKRPDFTLVFESKKAKKTVYIDAKYRNYKEQGRKAWVEDIKNTAIDKYIKTFWNIPYGAENEPIASFIVHPDTDEQWTFYGGYFGRISAEELDWQGRSEHRFGSFSFTPSMESNFITFTKLLLEYHFGLYDYCWNCGENTYSEDKIVKIEKTTDKGLVKYHYKCNNCGEFWVKNHCKFNKNHNLIKHVFNYHEIDPFNNNPWYVLCPECD